MNEISVSAECSNKGVDAGHERDPLALGEAEGSGEKDPLAVDTPLVKSEPSGDTYDEATSMLVEDTENKKTEVTLGGESTKAVESRSDDLKIGVSQNEEVETKPNYRAPIDSTTCSKPAETSSEAQTGNLSTVEVKTSYCNQEARTVSVHSPVIVESQISETNGTTEKNLKISEQNGIEKHESYEKLNGDHAKDLSSRKRSSSSADAESPMKKLCQEVEKNFPYHDNMINDYIQTSTKNNVDEIQRHTDQLLSEIQTLRGLAQKKELEWNNILHLKKVKEEILLRLLRKKQVLSFEKSPDVNGSEKPNELDFVNQSKSFTIDKSDEISGVAIKQPGSPSHTVAHSSSCVPPMTHYSPLMGAPPPYDKQASMNLNKPMFQHNIVMPGPRMAGFGVDMNGQLLAGYNMQMGRQGPVKDVKSIIADYRQRHPESVPRRGRRMKSLLNPQMGSNPRGMSPKMDNINNVSMILNSLDMVNQKSMLERLSQVQGGGLPNGVSFKDVLIQFANLQQQQLQGPSSPLPPPPRPQLESLLAGSGRPKQEAITVTRTTVPENRQQKDPSRAQSDANRTHTDAHKPNDQPSTSQRPPLPPPYPEISLHPVVSSSNSGDQGSQGSSLLHGILTKQASSSTQTMSPTLAKLLKSPEKKQAAASLVQAKSCGEITITPVQSKAKETGGSGNSGGGELTPQPHVQLEEEESEGSGGEGGEGSSGEGGSRLVIDEGAAGAGGGAGAADVPPCQGCRRRDAQFVCAGCANQWYCSRDCQVAAWDEHSEMCSG